LARSYATSCEQEGNDAFAGIETIRQLPVAVSNDAIMLVVRRRAWLSAKMLTLSGIDDFAWRRNRRYRTMIWDLQRRRTVVIQPDRKTAKSAASLRHYPSISIVTRDHGGGHGEGSQENCRMFSRSLTAGI